MPCKPLQPERSPMAGMLWTATGQGRDLLPYAATLCSNEVVEAQGRVCGGQAPTSLGERLLLRITMWRQSQSSGKTALACGLMLSTTSTPVRQWARLPCCTLNDQYEHSVGAHTTRPGTLHLRGRVAPHHQCGMDLGYGGHATNMSRSKNNTTHKQ
ncbi:hypothetical protein NDU88_002288 [Pleurodeles waltl]|uniref:Uncharacterized protein n=1 Tax=Pleurodeles waltl TaxID=8319 RepID=A0AAV7SC35_PLEWA|nr:hypothetical protein NDU88_002288 [Pleurodeles waltl]